MSNWRVTIPSFILVTLSTAILSSPATTAASENYDASLLGNGKIQAIINHPKFKMIEDGHLIKRKNLDGQVMHQLHNEKSYGNGDLEPDSVELYPVILGMIDPKSDLAAGTLDHVERLWNQDGLWNCGG